MIYKWVDLGLGIGVVIELSILIIITLKSPPGYSPLALTWKLILSLCSPSRIRRFLKKEPNNKRNSPNQEYCEKNPAYNDPSIHNSPTEANVSQGEGACQPKVNDTN
jgi:hypothetical protein